MALSVVGRYQAPLGFYKCHVQDPHDLDSIYMLGQSGANWYVYKFTWPSTIVQVADLGTWPTGKYFYSAQIADGNFKYGVGYVSTDRYLCFIGCTWGQIGADDTRVYEVNLETGTVDYYAPALGVPAAFMTWNTYGNVRIGYDGGGTFAWGIVFGSGSSPFVVRKYIGGGAGTYFQNQGNGPILEDTDQSFIGWDGSTFQINSTLAAGWTNQGSGYLPTVASLNALGLGVTVSTIYWAQSYFPNRAITWDDNWRYIVLLVGTGGSTWAAIGVKKNIVTGQWSATLINNNVTAVNWYADNCFDLWKDEGGKEKFYFTVDGYADKIYGSFWPLVMTNSLQLDGADGIVTFVATTEGGYSYVYHYNGAGYGSCISKIYDDEFVPDTAAPAISATGAKVLYKDKRVFFIKVPNYGRYLWWSAPYEPEALDASWDGYNTPVFEEHDNTALIDLQDSVYIGSMRGWKRLRGNSPDAWVLDKLPATIGPITDKTVAVTPFGAVYPRSDGLYLFNGYTTQYFCEEVKTTLENVNWDEINQAFSLWDGRYYRFFYPSGSATANDRELIVDLIAGINQARATEGDRAASAGFYDFATQTMYLGTEDGDIIVEGSSGSRSFQLATKEFPPGLLTTAGTFSKLHYDMDNKNLAITIIPVYDGVDQSPVTIPAYDGRKRSSVSLPKGNPFRVGIRIDITTTLDMRFYEPWILE